VTETEQKVAGGSQGIGAGLVEAYRQRGWAVVANSHRIKPSKDPDILTVQGDVSEQATADRIMSQALDRFGRVDTLVNNAGVFVSKPFTDYTADDYALVTGVNLAGFFWLTLCVPIARAPDELPDQETVCRSGNTSLSRPVLTSKTKPRTGTSGEIHGCDRAFSICSLVLATASVKL
jgi:NAD(P)-dependent dehydrogenase (short-subunit alcohol dehydrogenase family)